MKHAALPLALLLTAGMSQAYTITTLDTFQNGDVCASDSCDVVANTNDDRLLFDIQKGTLNVTGTKVTVDLYFDFGTNNTNLNSFFDAFTLNVGDLFFTVNGVDKYAVPFVNHSGLTAGDLYQVNSAAGLLSAQTALGGNPGDGATYRRDWIVWANNNGSGSTTDLGTGTTGLVGGGDGFVNPEFHLTYTFDTNGNPAAAGFAADAANASSFGFNFASATCGNDIIVSGVPEPGTIGLAGAALVGLGLLRRRRAA